MSLGMYQASVPVLVRILASSAAILDKAAAFCAAKKIEPGVIINYRLAPDMFALARQIQIMTAVAGMAGSHLAGSDGPKLPEAAATFDDLKARIAATVSYLGGLKAAQIDGTEAKDLTVKLGPTEEKFKGQEFLLGWALPNVYFHATTTYAILRHCGVDIGKNDFLGKA